MRDVVPRRFMGTRQGTCSGALCASFRIRRSQRSVPVEVPLLAYSFEDLHLGFAEDDVFAFEPVDSASRWTLEAAAMAATAVTSSMASLSLRGSSFREFNGLVAEAPCVRPAMPSPAHGVMRKPLRIEGASGEGLAGRGGVRIRLVRFGRKKLPYYRIIIASSRCRRDGRFLEMVGHYNPMADKNGVKDIQVNGDRIKYWLSVGAQPSDTVRNILYKQGVMTPVNPPEPVPAAEV